MRTSIGVAAVAALAVVVSSSCKKPEEAAPAAVANAPAALVPEKPKLREYSGPLGLKWGMSPAEVKATLGAKLTFEKDRFSQKANVLVQTWHGVFAGRATDEIGTEFCEEKLGGVSVIMQTRDEKPLYGRFRELVDMMRAEYGDPKEVAEPAYVRVKPDQRPATPDQDALMAMSGSLVADSIAQRLEKDVVAGTERLSAVWAFADQVAVVVAAVPDDKPNAYGQRPIRLMWSFGKFGDLEKCWSAGARNAKKDF